MIVNQIFRGQKLLRLSDQRIFQVTCNPTVFHDEQLKATFDAKRTELTGLVGRLPKIIGDPIARFMGWLPKEEKLTARMAICEGRMTTDEFTPVLERKTHTPNELAQTLKAYQARKAIWASRPKPVNSATNKE